MAHSQTIGWGRRTVDKERKRPVPTDTFIKNLKRQEISTGVWKDEVISRLWFRWHSCVFFRQFKMFLTSGASWCSRCPPQEVILWRICQSDWTCSCRINTFYSRPPSGPCDVATSDRWLSRPYTGVCLRCEWTASQRTHRGVWDIQDGGHTAERDKGQFILKYCVFTSCEIISISE